MNNVIAVHSTFSRNWILRSGFATSGRMPQKGLITSRNLTVRRAERERFVSLGNNRNDVSLTVSGNSCSSLTSHGAGS